MIKLFSPPTEEQLSRRALEFKEISRNARRDRIREAAYKVEDCFASGGHDFCVLDTWSLMESKLFWRGSVCSNCFIHRLVIEASVSYRYPVPQRRQEHD